LRTYEEKMGMDRCFEEERIQAALECGVNSVWVNWDILGISILAYLDLDVDFMT
jgi:hypothetical protein